MFQVNDDLSIYVTRGDAVYLKVSADNGGKPYTFEAGEVLRFKIYGKKDTENVVFQKDYPVEHTTQAVEIILTEADTKIGKFVNKPTDYWYEVELNPYNNHPQTIIGYDEDGAKLFRLFPEGGDGKNADDGIAAIDEGGTAIHGIDEELDMTSPRPVQNQAIARAFANLREGYAATHKAVAEKFVTPQMYGAICNGVADDTEAILLAMASGSDVFFPEGTYAVSHLPIPDGVTIRGCGAKSIIKHIDGASQYKYPIYINGVSNVTIESICIDGNGENQSQIGCGICIYSSHNITIRDCRIKNVHGDGIKVGHDNLLCTNIVVENCIVEGSERNEIALLHCENVRFVNCLINGGADTSALVDLELHGNNNHIQGVVFAGCAFIRNEGERIKILSNGFASTYDSVIFDNCSIQSSVFVKQFNNVTFKNCVCNGGFDLSDTTNITIRDCLITSTTNGVYAYKNVGSSSNLRVLGCNIEGTNYGIIVQNMENVIIGECIVQNSNVGIGINNAVTYSVLRDNRIVNNETGIKFEASTYRHNLIEGCYLDNTTDISGMVSAYTKIDDFTKATYE